MDESGILDFDKVEIKFLFLTQRRIESVRQGKSCLFSFNIFWNEDGKVFELNIELFCIHGTISFERLSIDYKERYF